MLIELLYGYLTASSVRVIHANVKCSAKVGLLEVKIPFIFSTGKLILNNNLQTVKDRHTVSAEDVNQWYMILLKPSAHMISTCFLNN